MTEPWRRSQVLALAAGFEGGLLALAVVIGYFSGWPALGDLFWNDRDAALGVLATLPLLCLYAVEKYWPFGPLRSLRRILDELVRPLFASCTGLDLLLISLLAGLGEEALFRGLLQPMLTDWLGVGLGLVLTAILFGLAHCLTLTYAIVAGVMGLYLGGLWLYAGNLLAVIVTHALYDFLVLLDLRHPPQGERQP